MSDFQFLGKFRMVRREIVNNYLKSEKITCAGWYILLIYKIFSDYGKFKLSQDIRNMIFNIQNFNFVTKSQ